MNFDFGEVLSRAWQITWKNKALWALSILPYLMTFLVFPVWLYIVFGIGIDSIRLERLFENQVFVIAAVVIYAAIILASLILGIMSRSSVTLGVYRAETDTQPITFVDLLKGGLPYFWRIFGVLLLIQLSILALFLAFFACLAVLSVLTMGIAAFCLQPLFLLLVPALWLVTAYMEQAEAAIVADGMGVRDALKRGYEVLRANPGKFILMTVIIFIGIGLLVSLITFPVMLPMFFMMMRNFESGMEANDVFRLQAVFGIIFFPLMALVQGVSLTFLKSAMIIMYLRLTRSPLAPQPVLQEAV